jgi:hypothetical protein
MALRFRHRLPGYLATGLLTVASALWTLWAVGGMYHEGWWGAWTDRLPYLVPPAICVAFALLALAWPHLGGWIILLLGGAFAAWRWIRQAQLGPLTWQWILSWIPAGGVLVMVGILFLLEGRYRRQRSAEGWTPPKQRLRRYLRYVFAISLPLLTTILVSVYFAPLLVARYDSGERNAQRIEGNGVILVWAPAGPGWNWRAGADQGRWLSGMTLPSTGYLRWASRSFPSGRSAASRPPAPTCPPPGYAAT